MDLANASDNPVMAGLFPEARNPDRDKKRPSTAGFKIKESIQALVAELTKVLLNVILFAHSAVQNALHKVH